MRIVVFLAALLTAVSALAEAPPYLVSRPTHKVGDTWIYNRLNGRSQALEHVSLNIVREVAAGRILMDSSNLDGSDIYKIRRNGDFNLAESRGPDGSYKRSLPFYPSFSFPLKIGKTWRRNVDFSASDKPGNEVHAKLEARVAGWESVTVPAGTFMALKIELTGWYVGQNMSGFPLDGRIEDTLWYAPEVHNVVRSEYRDTAGGATYSHEIYELMRYWLVP